MEEVVLFGVMPRYSSFYGCDWIFKYSLKLLRNLFKNFTYYFYCSQVLQYKITKSSLLIDFNLAIKSFFKRKPCSISRQTFRVPEAQNQPTGAIIKFHFLTFSVLKAGPERILMKNVRWTCEHRHNDIRLEEDFHLRQLFVFFNDCVVEENKGKQCQEKRVDTPDISTGSQDSTRPVPQPQAQFG